MDPQRSWELRFRPTSVSSNPKDPKSPHFGDRLFEMKAQATADGMDMDQEAKMTYIRDRVGDLAFIHLVPRLRPGC